MSYAICRTWHNPYPGSLREPEVSQVMWYRRPVHAEDEDVWVIEPKGGVTQLVPDRDITIYHNRASAEFEIPKGSEGLVEAGLSDPVVVEVPLRREPIVG